MRAIEILAAHWAIETWWGKACHCWNLGNAKGRAGGVRDWTYFTCGEELSRGTAVRAASDPRVTIVREYVSGGRARASVRIVPEHPWCCFRAFENLTAGATDHLELLHRRFAAAFEAALDGEPRAFSVELKRAGYYTADVEQYTKGVLGCLPRVKLAAAQVDWDECPLLTEGQIEQVEGIMALSAELDDDDWKAMRAERDALVAADND